MSWLEDIINGVWDIIFEGDLEALQGIYDFLLNIPGLLAELFVAVMFLLTYPFIAIIDVLREIFNHFWEIFAAFINLPINFINTSFELQAIALPYFPPTWMWLIFLMISLRVSIIIIRWIWAVIP